MYQLSRKVWTNFNVSNEIIPQKELKTYIFQKKGLLPIIKTILAMYGTFYIFDPVFNIALFSIFCLTAWSLNGNKNIKNLPNDPSWLRFIKRQHLGIFYYASNYWKLLRKSVYIEVHWYMTQLLRNKQWTVFYFKNGLFIHHLQYQWFKSES